MVTNLRLLSLAMAFAGWLITGQCFALERFTVDVGGHERNYLMERPSADKPLPTVIMMHGRGGQPAGIARGTGLGEIAGREGFVAVFPAGLDHAWNSGRPGAPKSPQDADDVAFLRALVADLVKRGVTDPTRVYLAGFSAGGFMTLRMACEAAETFAAVATIEANMFAVGAAKCHPSRSLPFLAISGTADRQVPYNGGKTPRNDELWSTDQTLAFYRKLDGCTDETSQSQLPAPEPQTSGVAVVRWTQCSRAPVVLFRIEGGVHRVPNAPFAAEKLWAFFRGKSLNAAAVQPSPQPQPTAGNPPEGRQEVQFESNGHQLYGCIQRPAGAGPFPTIIYNHGSEKRPGRCSPPELASAYVKHGYLFFSFHRHGHGRSPGEYIGDRQEKIRREIDNQAEQQRQIAALQDEYNLDVVGAVEWLIKQPEVDPKRVAMTGVSFGGIQTLITAEKGVGIRAFIAFAPGAMSWGNPAVRARLERAARNAKAPLFLAQAQNDYSLGPSEMLGPIVRAKGPPNEAKVYPAFGTTHQEGHAGFAVGGGIPIWSPDVFAFLDATMPAR